MSEAGSRERAAGRRAAPKPGSGGFIGGAGAQHGAEGPLLPLRPPRDGPDVPGALASPDFLWVPDLVSRCLGATEAKGLGLRDGGWRGSLGGGSSSELSSGWGCMMERGADGHRGQARGGGT